LVRFRQNQNLAFPKTSDLLRLGTAAFPAAMALHAHWSWTIPISYAEMGRKLCSKSRLRALEQLSITS